MTAFSSFMDRSRLDALDSEAARLVLDVLRSFANEDDCVHQAVLYAGKSIYHRQYWSMNAFDDFVLAETERLLRLARNHDGAWHPEPGPVQQEIAAAPGKRAASVEEIEAEIVARASRLEDMGFRPIEIGRALARAGLTFAPVGFIDIINRVRTADLDGRAERQRAFLDDCLGEDRYSGKKSRR